MLEDWTRSDTIAVIAIVVSALTALFALWVNRRLAQAERRARREDWRTDRTAQLRDEASRALAEVRARILTLSPDRLSTLPFEDRVEFIGGMVESWYHGGVAERVERLCGMRELEHVPRMARRAKRDVVSYLELLSHVSVRDRPPESRVPGVTEVLVRLEEHGRGDGAVQLPSRVSGDERGRLWVDAQYEWEEARLGVAQLEETIWGRGPYNEDVEE